MSDPSAGRRSHPRTSLLDRCWVLVWVSVLACGEAADTLPDASAGPSTPDAAATADASAPDLGPDDAGADAGEEVLTCAATSVEGGFFPSSEPIDGRLEVFTQALGNRPVDESALLPDLRVLVTNGATTLEGRSDARGCAVFAVAEGPVDVHVEGPIGMASLFGADRARVRVPVPVDLSEGAPSPATLTGRVTGFERLSPISPTEARYAIVVPSRRAIFSPSLRQARRPSGLDSNVVAEGGPRNYMDEVFRLSAPFEPQVDVFAVGGIYVFDTRGRLLSARPERVGLVPDVALTSGAEVAVDVDLDVALDYPLVVEADLASAPPEPLQLTVIAFGVLPNGRVLQGPTGAESPLTAIVAGGVGSLAGVRPAGAAQLAGPDRALFVQELDAVPTSTVIRLPSFAEVAEVDLAGRALTAGVPSRAGQFVLVSLFGPQREFLWLVTSMQPGGHPTEVTFVLPELPEGWTDPLGDVATLEFRGWDFGDAPDFTALRSFDQQRRFSLRRAPAR